MKTIFTGSREYPFHLSVGVVLINKEGKIGCHFFKKEDLPFESEGKSDLYLLVRETPEPNETIEKTIHRGLLEEFGAKGTIRHFLGAIESWFPGVTTGIKINKTTLYFIVDLISHDPSKRKKDSVESKSEILWLDPKDLHKIFVDQGKKYERTDLNESLVIKRYLENE